MALIIPTQEQQTFIHGWNHLPDDVISLIGEHLDSYTDYIRFRAVCASCRSTLPNWPKHQYYQVPRLMIPHKALGTPLFRGFFNPLNHEIYSPDLSEVRGPCLGSSDGWLVLLEQKCHTLKLFNPLTKSQIQLPPTSSLPDPYLISNPTAINHQNDVQINTYVHKIVLLHSKDHFIAVAIYNVFSKLAFTKPGDDKWTTIPTSDIYDCIFFHAKIYALTKFRDLVVFSIDDPTQVVDVHVASMRAARRSPIESTLYLVSRDNDELLMVERLFKLQKVQLRGQTVYMSKTLKFNLYKLDWAGSSATWSKVYNLDGYAIFLGLNTSLCVSSRDCPKLRGNQIFYTNDSMKLDNQGKFCGHEFGVYDVGDGICHNFLGDYGYPSHPYVWPNPIWVVLNPY